MNTMHHAVTDGNNKLIRKFASETAAKEFERKMKSNYPKASFSYQFITKRVTGSSMYKRDGSKY